MATPAAQVLPTAPMLATVAVVLTTAVAVVWLRSGDDRGSETSAAAPEVAPAATVSNEAAAAEIAAAPAFDRLLGRESVPFELRVSRQEQALTVVELAGGDPQVRVYQLD
jgi:hypothetical protein